MIVLFAAMCSTLLSACGHDYDTYSTSHSAQTPEVFESTVQPVPALTVQNINHTPYSHTDTPMRPKSSD